MNKHLKRTRHNCYMATVPLYNQSFFIAFSVDDASNFTKDTIEPGLMAMVREYESDPPLMVLVDKSHNSITHECYHLLMCISHYVGLSHSYEHQEHGAYMIGFIAECVYDALADWQSRQ